MSGNDPAREAFDPYTPAEIAERVQAGGVAKAALDLPSTLALAVLAGAFIGLGALASTVAATDTGLGYGPTRLLAGLAFSLGLVLVVVGGAELFTGNNLIVIAWAERRVTTAALLRSWAIVYAGNFIGATATALGVHLSGVQALGGGEVERTALAIATAKVSLGWGEAFLRGAFCNALVCLAVWLGFSARTTTDKILCVVFPITAFVAAGFEHSIANMYFIPIGALVEAPGAGVIGWSGLFLANLVPVTLGNVAGGSMMVGLAYWFIYLRRDRAACARAAGVARWRAGARRRLALGPVAGVRTGAPSAARALLPHDRERGRRRGHRAGDLRARAGPAAGVAVVGRSKVARFHAGIARLRAGETPRVELRRYNGAPAVVVEFDPAPEDRFAPRFVTLGELDAAGLVRRIYTVAAPAKLERVAGAAACRSA